MIDLYYWTTPNGHKITLFLEETGLPYRIHPVNISKGDQFKPEFLAIAPNNRIPAIVDQAPADGGPLSLFESGAILLYLAEKTGRFLPADLRGRQEVSQWLFWQMAGWGPWPGRTTIFGYAPERIPYAIERYVKETNRLYGVLNKRLADREFVAGDYSIADMAAYPWIVPHAKQGQDLNDFPHLKRWFDAIAARRRPGAPMRWPTRSIPRPRSATRNRAASCSARPRRTWRAEEAAMSIPTRSRARSDDLPAIVALLADDALAPRARIPRCPSTPATRTRSPPSTAIPTSSWPWLSWIQALPAVCSYRSSPACRAWDCGAGRSKACASPPDCVAPAWAAPCSNGQSRSAASAAAAWCS